MLHLIAMFGLKCKKGNKERKMRKETEKDSMDKEEEQKGTVRRKIPAKQKSSFVNKERPTQRSNLNLQEIFVKYDFMAR